MAKAASSSLLVARESFVAELDGTEYDIKEGELIEADHPLARKLPHQFIAPTLRFPKVEQATAAPGEKRGA
jgi:hypothetical protein